MTASYDLPVMTSRAYKTQIVVANNMMLTNKASQVWWRRRDRLGASKNLPFQAICLSMPYIKKHLCCAKSSETLRFRSLANSKPYHSGQICAPEPHCNALQEVVEYIWELAIISEI